jgi:hypothetical protein
MFNCTQYWIYTDIKIKLKSLFNDNCIPSSFLSPNINFIHTNASKKVVSDIEIHLRIKFGNLLSRNHVDALDKSNLSKSDKENLRKLKISLANKGRKPWNTGKQHHPDTVMRIKEKTRLAMHRTDVRKRWETGWEPKPHTWETKKKLRTIMLKREELKFVEMLKWIQQEIGIYPNTYESLTFKTKNTYRRIFSLKRQRFLPMNEISLTLTEKEKYNQTLYEINENILNIHASESDRTRLIEKIKNIPNRKPLTKLNRNCLNKSLNSHQYSSRKIVFENKKDKLETYNRQHKPKRQMKLINYDSLPPTTNKNEAVYVITSSSLYSNSNTLLRGVDVHILESKIETFHQLLETYYHINEELYSCRKSLNLTRKKFGEKICFTIDVITKLKDILETTSKHLTIFKKIIQKKP